jgi:hypothetical protein
MGVLYALDKMMWHSLNKERDKNSFMGWNEFDRVWRMKFVYIVSNTKESWKQIHETPIKIGLTKFVRQ